MKKVFSQEEWNGLLSAQVEEIKRLSTLKGGEYAGDVDRLANFRRNGEALGVPMELVWAVYAGKHWDAVQQFVKDLTVGRERERGEPIEGRVDDLMVYLLLLKAILKERKRDGILGEGKKVELAATGDASVPDTHHSPFMPAAQCLHLDCFWEINEGGERIRICKKCRTVVENKGIEDNQYYIGLKKQTTDLKGPSNAQ